MIRTEASYIDGQVTLEGYRQAQKELGLKYYIYDAFLDNRTSKICEELNKQHFLIDEATVGINYPPMHPNCRSTTELELDKDYEREESIKDLTEFNDFSKFNKKAYELANISMRGDEKNPVDFARKFYDKNTLNSFYKVGALSNEQMKLIGAKSSDVKFSMDSMIKNRLRHPDLNFYDYQKINDIIQNPDEIKIDKKRNNCILLIKKDKKTYQAVIKTTKDKSENYLTSFRYAEH